MELRCYSDDVIMDVIHIKELPCKEKELMNNIGGHSLESTVTGFPKWISY